MQTLSPSIACITALENAYATMADHTAPWPYDALMLALTMGAAQSRQTDHRHYRMAANALATRSAVQREALAAKVQIPANLLTAAEAPPDWPEPQPVQTLDGEVPVDLAAAQTHAHAQVYSIADRVRRLYIPSIHAQDGVYLLKAQEAATYLAQDPEPSDLTPYPHIADEADATGETPAAVASAIAGKAAQFAAASAKLEAARIKAQADIESAVDTAGVDAAQAAFEAAAEALTM